MDWELEAYCNGNLGRHGDDNMRYLDRSIVLRKPIKLHGMEYEDAFSASTSS